MTLHEALMQKKALQGPKQKELCKAPRASWNFCMVVALQKNLDIWKPQPFGWMEAISTNYFLLGIRLDVQNCIEK